MSNNTTTTYELTNTCNCNLYSEGDEVKSIDDTYNTVCFGDCWEFAVEDFTMFTETLRDSNETGWWKVTNLALWSGNVSGYFHANTVADIIAGMTVNSEWTMRYTPYDDRIEYSLSHHDSMGSNTTLTAISDEEREELGLY
jgi:hypothetical protein